MSAHTDSPNKEKATAAPEPTKHRACDECRYRKKICTKEPDGCSRCKRERVTCHYSPQKVMGRPKKPRPQTSSVFASASPREIAPKEQDQPARNEDGMGNLDLSGNAVLPDDPNLNDSMNFLDYLGADFIPTQPLQSTPLPRQMPIERGLLNINIDFDPPVPPQPANNVPSGLTPPGLAYHTLSTQGFPSQRASPIDSIQYRDPAGAHPPPPPPPITQGLPPEATPSVNPNNYLCMCLSKLYTSLSSILALPEDITAATQCARNACRIAHDAIQCSNCMPATHEPVMNHMVTFTVMMTLGSLLPCLANVYHMILRMIDEETTRAITEKDRSRLCFSLAANGGIWPRYQSQHQERDTGNDNNHNNNDDWSNSIPACAEAMTRFDQQDMDPGQWRLTLRALLKIDVYGLHRCDGGDGFMQVGLRDLVAMMDEKSQRRHEVLDEMLEAGLTPPAGLAGVPVEHSVLSDPPCRQIIAMARRAVDGIVIA